MVQRPAWDTSPFFLSPRMERVEISTSSITPPVLIHVSPAENIVFPHFFWSPDHPQGGKFGLPVVDVYGNIQERPTMASVKAARELLPSDEHTDKMKKQFKDGHTKLNN